MTPLAALLIALPVGAVLGACVALLWCGRRAQAQRIELELLRARLQTEAALAAERDQAAERTREQLQGVFGELARDSLKSNSEVFLQLARERLAREQNDAAQTLKDRERAIESMVLPIREALAKTETQIQSIERERNDAFTILKTQMELLAAGQQQLSRETRNLVTALRRPDVRGQWGELTLRRVVELSGMSAHVDFTERHPARHDRAHARTARHRGRRQDAARGVSVGDRSR
jgi:DNA recombination protein RmuC